MIPRKSKRHKLYKEALERFKKRKAVFICVAISDSSHNNSLGKRDYYTSEVPDLFPELKKREPRYHYAASGWWNPQNRSIRMKVLKQCIKETLPKKK